MVYSFLSSEETSSTWQKKYESLVHVSIVLAKHSNIGRWGIDEKQEQQIIAACFSFLFSTFKRVINVSGKSCMSGSMYAFKALK